MPIHDWSHVEAGIFHHFHHAWIEEISRALNAGLLPDNYYALAEQQSGPFGPDVLTLQSDDALGGFADDQPPSDSDNPQASTNVLLAAPQVELTAEANLQFYRRKQSLVAVRHVSGDEIIAVVEIVSRGNKSSKIAMRSLIDKAAELLTNGVHLILIDLHPPGPRDPDGIHALLWNEMTAQEYATPDKPLTLAAYEASPIGATRAYVQPVAVGDSMPDMPLFLRPGAHLPLPLDATYDRAFAAIPKRWRNVIAPTP